MPQRYKPCRKSKKFVLTTYDCNNVAKQFSYDLTDSPRHSSSDRLIHVYESISKEEHVLKETQLDLQTEKPNDRQEQNTPLQKDTSNTHKVNVSTLEKGCCSRALSPVISTCNIKPYSGEISEKNCILNNKSHTLLVSKYFDEKGKNKLHDQITSDDKDLDTHTSQELSKVRDIVRKLVALREKEKHEEMYDSFIRKLKRKHCNTNNYRAPVRPPKYKSTSEEDSSQLSDQYDNLIRDLYLSLELDVGSPKTDKFNYTANGVKDNTFKTCNNQFCYVTSSTGRLIMLERQRKEEAMRNRYMGHYWKHKRDEEMYKNSQSKRPKTRPVPDAAKKMSSPKCASIQTELQTLPLFVTKSDCKFVNDIAEKYHRISTKADNLKRDIYESPSPQSDPLTSIETKLDDMMQSLQTFMMEIMKERSLNVLKNTKSTMDCDNDKRKVHFRNQEERRLSKIEEIVCGLSFERRNNFSSHSDYAKNLSQEDIYNTDKRHSTTQIESLQSEDFEIPCRDISTEVTASLAKTNNKDSRPESKVSVRQVAINTEPLSLFGLFRISTDTVKKMLSFLPQFDYYSYLMNLSLQQLGNKKIQHYVCNICGSAFDKPSELSDHIAKHNLERSRDCCLCRHVIDSRRHRPGLFQCRHCGQRFVRAYCCELHQTTCSRRLDLEGERSSLILLR